MKTKRCLLRDIHNSHIWNIDQICKYVTNCNLDCNITKEYLVNILSNKCDATINSKNTIAQSLKYGMYKEQTHTILFYMVSKMKRLIIEQQQIDSFIVSNIAGFVVFSKTQKCNNTWNIDISCHENANKRMKRNLIDYAVKYLIKCGAKHIQTTVAGHNKENYIYKLLLKYGAKYVNHSLKCSTENINKIDLVIDISVNTANNTTKKLNRR